LPDTSIDEALVRLARNDSGRVVALLARRFGDLDLADECVQEAIVTAAQRWPDDGVPDNPGGWLMTVARNRAIDRLRSEGARHRATERLAREPQPEDGPNKRDSSMILDDEIELPDERLRLMLLTCHPALNPDAQVALMLRLVAGLTTDEIAAAFLSPTPTVAQRITRAKAKIRTAGIPMSVPNNIDARLERVLEVVYLTFNEGYLSRSESQDPLRADLCESAIALLDVIVDLSPDHAEAHGLLALCRFQHARRDARFQGDAMVLLPDQDRTRWHGDEIRLGNAALATAMRQHSPGRFQVEALIASFQANARTADDVDWPQIVALYDQLAAMYPSPIVELNRAAAVASADGPHAGLAALERVSGIDDLYLYHAIRGELLNRCGDTREAAAALTRALDLTRNSAERRLLEERLANIT